MRHCEGGGVDGVGWALIRGLAFIVINTVPFKELIIILFTGWRIEPGIPVENHFI